MRHSSGAVVRSCWGLCESKLPALRARAGTANPTTVRVKDDWRPQPATISDLTIYCVRSVTVARPSRRTIVFRKRNGAAFCIGAVV